MNITEGPFKGLNPQQAEAAAHLDGPACVRAVVGSGKTTIIVKRLRNLLTTHKIPAERLLLVTFTKKAAGEMLDRLEKEMGERVAVTGGTFHSVCYRICREHRDAHRLPSPKILDAQGQKTFLRKALKEADIQEDVMGPAELSGYITRFKANGWMPVAAKGFLKNPTQEVATALRAWACYENMKQGMYMDFDDMLIEAVSIFRRFPQVCEKYANRWQYVTVDEYQDTNHVQEDFLRLLCEKRRNLFVVGDDDQSIYSWRGAVPKYLIEFEKAWPEARLYTMENNYRCPGAVVDFANKLIHNNTLRVEKTIRPNKDSGLLVTSRAFYMEQDQAEWVADEIEMGIGEGRKPSEYAILYRVNSLSRAFEAALNSRKIPYVIEGAVGFWSRSEIKDLVAYLQLATQRDCALRNQVGALERIYNRPSRYFGKVALEQVRMAIGKMGYSVMDGLTQTVFERRTMKAAALNLHADLAMLQDSYHRGADARELIAIVREDMEYDRWLMRDQGCDVDEIVVDTLDELEEAAGTMGLSPEAFVDYALAEDQRAQKDVVDDSTQKDVVRLMSFHRAKGLEWDTVFVTGTSESIVPHSRAESTEEERRLLFVAITRARKELKITTIGNRHGKVLIPSTFIREGGIETHGEKKEDGVGGGSGGGSAEPSIH